MFKIQSRQPSAGPSVRPRRVPARTFTAAALSLFALTTAAAQGVFKPPTPVTYTEKYEIFPAGHKVTLNCGGLKPMDHRSGKALGTKYGSR